MSETLLSVRAMRKSFGGFVALDRVSIDIPTGGIVGLIGPNGSGKSTLFDCICAFHRRDSGTVVFAGQDISHMPPQRIARAGLRRTFQQLRVFPEMSLRQNLLTAAQSGPNFSLLAEVFRSSAVRRHEAALNERATTLLEDIRLTRLADSAAGGLSYGQKKLLELAMALMGEPKLLLLDEPMAGVNPSLIEDLKQELLSVNRRGVALLIVEHNLKLVFEITRHIYVLDQGRLLAEGAPDAIAGDARVIDAYLGRRDPRGAAGRPVATPHPAEGSSL